MNSIKNDRGEVVPAVGAPGSEQRAATAWPRLIADLNHRYDYGYGRDADDPGAEVWHAGYDIFEAGVTDQSEISAILAASKYGTEPVGSPAYHEIRKAAAFRDWEPRS